MGNVLINDYGKVAVPRSLRQKPLSHGDTFYKTLTSWKFPYLCPAECFSEVVRCSWSGGELVLRSFHREPHVPQT